VFHAACAACVEDDPAVNSFVSTLVASWEYDRFLALVREFVADEAAMDVLQDVMGGDEDEDEDEDEDGDEDGDGENREGRSTRARECGDHEDFSAFT